MSATRRKFGLRTALQLLGFLIGITLLVLVLREASSPEHREGLSRLGRAPWHSLLLVLGLTAGAIVLNGCVFHALWPPGYKIRFLDIQSVNAIAHVLNNLPFKMSMFFRLFVHRARDKVPLLTLSAWLVASGVMIIAGLLPAFAAGVWFDSAGLAWGATIVGGVVLLTASILAASALASSRRGWGMVVWFMSKFGRAGRVLISGETGERVHAGLGLMARPRPMATVAALRLAELTLHTWRFDLVARIAGEPMELHQVVLIAATYFLIGSAAPTGALGVREAGTATMAHAVADDAQAVVILAVTGAEVLVALMLAAGGVAWLRPDKLLRNRTHADNESNGELS